MDTDSECNPAAVPIHRRSTLSVLHMLLTCRIGFAVLLMTGNANATDTIAPLADAAQHRNFDVIRALLEQGADVDAVQADGMTALHWAVWHDELTIAQLLIEHGADVNVQNRYGVPPLSLACRNGHGEIVNLMLQSGADANVSLRGGETVLMTAARTGRPQPVRALIAAGADVNARDDNNQTAVMWAAAEGHAAVVRALIEAEADFLTPLRSGFTPFFFAVREGRSEVINVLLNAGVDVNDLMKPRSGGRRSRTTPLILAVENAHFELATALLEAGADPNAAPAGYTALHAITWVRRPLLGDSDPAPLGSGRLSSLDFVRVLIASGANVDARYDQQALMKGGRYGGGRAQFAMAGSTTLLMAARNSDLRLLNLLLEAGADWQIPNADNYTALLAAAGVGALGSGDAVPGTEPEAIETVRLMLNLGCDIDAVTDTGETVMHGAAYQERPGVVHFLAEQGADISVWNRENQFGWTPLMIARGHRPGNFRPSPGTISSIEKVMRAGGAEVPPEEPRISTEDR